MKSALPVSLSFFWRGVEKNESGSVLAGQAGMEVTGWRMIMGPVRKDMRREVLAG